VTAYTGLWKLLYDWQTIIANILAILAAFIGGGMAYWAGRVQANATRTAADLQASAANAQLAHLKVEKEENDQQANRDFIIPACRSYKSKITSTTEACRSRQTTFPCNKSYSYTG
jgi:hypothetical protein